MATLFKATNIDLAAGHDYDRPTVYAPGTDVTATDWIDNDLCGGGLHLSPHPRMAASYRSSAERGMRFLKVTVPVKSLRPLGDDKCKVPSCRVVAEVDAHGRELAVATPVPVEV